MSGEPGGCAGEGWVGWGEDAASAKKGPRRGRGCSCTEEEGGAWRAEAEVGNKAAKRGDQVAQGLLPLGIVPASAVTLAMVEPPVAQREGPGNDLDFDLR